VAAEDDQNGTRLSAKQIYENVRVSAEEEMQRPARALFWSAVAAGLTIAFSFLAAGYLATLVEEPYREAAASAGYPLGFIFVVLARNQLFTENTLEPIIPLLHRPGLETLRALLSLWAVVLVGNLVGALAVATVFARTSLLRPDLHRALETIAEQATTGGFWMVAYKGVFAGWLIALMAWLIASTRATGAQVLLVWLTTAPISAFGFRHSIAGAVEAFYLAWRDGLGWGAALGGFILPAILGNIAGGVSLVALVNHGQVAPETAESSKP
jgi:formate/nitrite transporter FocA (FNT family)